MALFEAQGVDRIERGRRLRDARQQCREIGAVEGQQVMLRIAQPIEVGREAGLVDLLALPGYYFMLALVLNSARTPQTGGDPGPFATDQAWPSKLPPR